jgi:hypothetical protein
LPKDHNVPRYALSSWPAPSRCDERHTSSRARRASSAKRAFDRRKKVDRRSTLAEEIIGLPALGLPEQASQNYQ